MTGGIDLSGSPKDEDSKDEEEFMDAEEDVDNAEDDDFPDPTDPTDENKVRSPLCASMDCPASL